jgi:hypothetical protein
VTEKYREKNEEKQRKKELEKKRETEKLDKMINMEMEDSIHMIKVHQRFYQKLSNMMAAGGTDIPRYTHNLDLDRDSILNGFERRAATEYEK